MQQESLKIILRTYSKGGINEDEAVQLIEDIYNKTVYPYIYPWSLPTIRYDTEFPKYEVTCSKTK